MLIKAACSLESLASGDHKKELYEEGKRVCGFQFRGYGTRRQTLPPLPYFPSELELREVKKSWQQAQEDELSAWLSVGIGNRNSMENGG
jgi:hypothetical protein